MPFFDADVHCTGLELYKDLNPDFYERLKINCPAMDMDQVWKRCYDDMKGPDWPDCGPVSEFHLLPKWIRQEIRDIHKSRLIFVSEDLEYVCVDHADNEWADIDTVYSSGKNIVKVDRQLINASFKDIQAQYLTEKSLAVDIMKHHNRMMLDFCQEKPRFDANAWLALQDLDASMQELEHIIPKGFFGVRLEDNIPWGFLKQFHEVFEICEKHNMPLYLHLTSFVHAPIDWKWDYTSARYQQILKVWPIKPFIQDLKFNWLPALASLITEGVLEKYPNIRFVTTEHGLEWIPEFLEIFKEQGWPDPLPYFKKNFWFTTEPEEPNFLEIANLIGWDRLLFATDYPHNDGFGDNRFNDVDLVTGMKDSGQISVEDFDLFTHKNYQKLKDRV